jgi:hypothetical protein
MATKAQRCILSIAIMLFGLCRVAEAGGITDFTDRPTFNAAVGAPLTVEDFTDSDHFPITTGILNSQTNLVVESGSPITPGLIQPGVTYSTPIRSDAPGGFFFNIDAGGGFAGGFLDGLGAPSPSTALTTTFDNPVNGFGFDTNTLMGTQFTITINFTSGPADVETLPINGASFFGFVSTATDIQSATLFGNSSTFTFGIDNFTFPTSAANAVPEPSSAVLASLATLTGLVYGWRRRHGRGRPVA